MRREALTTPDGTVYATRVVPSLRPMERVTCTRCKLDDDQPRIGIRRCGFCGAVIPR